MVDAKGKMTEKASGKPVVHAFDGCEHWPQGTGKRIAELEDELATWKERCGQAEVALKHTETDAEKAEAEVERLRVEIESRRSAQAVLARRVAESYRGVNPSGVRWCHTCESWPHEPDCPDIRKEAD